MLCKTPSYNLPISHHPSPPTLNCSYRPHSASSHETHHITATQSSSQPTTLFNIRFQTLEACRLGIGRYPDFDYNANGGTSTGTGIGSAAGNFDAPDKISTIFDIEKLYIPPLTGATTRFLGLPLPPLLKIDIAPEIFQGSISRSSGKVELHFRAKFWFSIGSVYRAPPLMVETVLTSEESKGGLRGGKGERLDEEGKCRLVGVATVDPIEDSIMNAFLSLPTECIAEINAQIFMTAAS
ncbi:uncharacterized protein LOC110020395 [Phalaenopsis equestris]|uniref:uncharacterized protein LOC110020395 n=1 Tax=Phalaenopsis equestris TaxID=78828 RepID=UPI0009E227DC|nr:uncharacterized protein LOC110020395 [Phalaenopsis equestris]